MTTIYINGKFTAQRTTGVQRLAIGLVEGLDNALQTRAASERWVLLCPFGANTPVLRNIEVRVVGYRGLNLHAWEQIVLPLMTVGSLLLNLSGPAPLLKRNQVCMLPDAAMFDHSEAYTKAFVSWYQFLFKRLAHSSKVVLTISRFSQERLAMRLDVDRSRLHVVHCGGTHMDLISSDPSIYQRLGLPGVRYLLAVGSLNPTKNLPALIEAFREVASAHVRLVLVGGANDAVFTRSTQLANDPRVVWTGSISDSQLKVLYSNALAFVFPSLYEGFGLPPLEAMSLGCPVIASNAASIPEICGDAVLYFDPTSRVEMAAAIARVVSDTELREDLRCRGNDRARAFTWHASGSQLLNILRTAGLLARS